MDELAYGKRTARGDWAPNEPAEMAPLFTLPPRPLAVLKWLPHYFLPYNLLFAASAVAWWHWVLPEPEVMRTLEWGWILRLFGVNCLAILLFFGVYELRLYGLRSQGSRFKYHAKFPSDQKSPAFWRQSQNAENILRTFASAIPIWTAIEVAILYAYANGNVPWLSFAENPVYLALLALAVPVIHETHFYCVHRLIHWKSLYRWVHSVHHKSVNPTPWSSLAMHPVELLLYLGVAFWHLIIPSNPILALYQLHFAGFGAIPGHIGFHKVELGSNRAMDSHAYLHHLHHKFFEVNYGDGLVPLDRWFGTLHDGSDEAEARMMARRKGRRAAGQARKAG